MRRVKLYLNVTWVFSTGAWLCFFFTGCIGCEESAEEKVVLCMLVFTLISFISPRASFPIHVLSPCSSRNNIHTCHTPCRGGSKVSVPFQTFNLAIFSTTFSPRVSFLPPNHGTVSLATCFVTFRRELGRVFQEWKIIDNHTPCLASFAAPNCCRLCLTHWRSHRYVVSVWWKIYGDVKLTS